MKLNQWNEPNDNEGFTGYIYITTNLVNGKRYIGQKTARLFDPNYLGSGKILKKAISKYGRENFVVETIAWYENKDELNKAERFWIRYYNAQKSPYFYNIAEGGHWGDYIDSYDIDQYEEHSKLVSERTKIAMQDPEVHDRLVESHVGYVMPQSQKDKIGETNRKLFESEEHRRKHREGLLRAFADGSKGKKISEALKGTKRTPEQCRHISESLKGKSKSSEAIKNMKESKTKYIYTYENLEFKGIGEIKRYFRSIPRYSSLSQLAIEKVCSGNELKRYPELSGKISKRLKED